MPKTKLDRDSPRLSHSEKLSENVRRRQREIKNEYKKELKDIVETYLLNLDKQGLEKAMMVLAIELQIYESNGGNLDALRRTQGLMPYFKSSLVTKTFKPFPQALLFLSERL